MLDHADVLRRGFDEFAKYVNPALAQRAQIAGEPVHVVAAREGRLVDRDGNEIEDFHGTQALGHRHPRIAAALIDFLGTDAPNWYPSRVSPHAGRLARRLCERTGYTSAYFTFTGSDGVEAALKLARAVTGRPGVICLDRAYHGCGMGAVALMEPGPLHDPFAPHLPGVRRVPLGDVDALARELARGDVGAVVVEPIQGEGGVRPLPSPFVEALCELAPAAGALVFADEVQTGMGRSGRLLLSAEWPRRPDGVVLAKQLGGGLMPLSAFLTTRELFDRAYGHDFEVAEAHNSTFGPSSLGMVAGLAMLDVLTDDLIARSRAVGEEFRAMLARALDGSPLFREVRGEGLMIGIQLAPADHPWLSFESFGMGSIAERGRPTIAPLLCHRLYRRGFYTFACGHDWSVLRIQPRFEVPRSVLERFARDCRAELDYLQSLT